MTEQKQKSIVESALRGLAKLLKATHYYPPRHPALQSAAKEAWQSFAPLLSDGSPLVLQVSRESFKCDELSIAPGNPAMVKLANFLFARRIHTLLLLPDLSMRDLQVFISRLSQEPRSIYRQGGVEHLLQQGRVTTIWVNEIDLSRILSRKEELETTPEPLEGEEEPSEEDAQDLDEMHPASLEELFERLQEAAEDTEYQHILRELTSLLRIYLAQTPSVLILEILDFLRDQASSPQATTTRREASRKALQQLGTDEILILLVKILCSQGLESDLMQKTHRLLLTYRGTIAPLLMERLIGEGNPQARRCLMDALARQEEHAIATLREHLTDSRWYVVRNVAAILGEIRQVDTVPLLESLLQHQDIRVRREAIRALTRIGGNEATTLLLELVHGDDPEMSRQSLLSLGAMKNSNAVPSLLQIASQKDPLGKKVELRRGAVKALGEIGTPEAVSTLSDILRHRTLWKRNLQDQVRATAAAALGEIGSEEGRGALEEALDDRSPAVSRAAAQALKQMRKGENGT